MYRVIDFENPQEAEIDENTCRVDFTPEVIHEICKFYTEKLSKQGARTDKQTVNFVLNQNEVERPIDVVAKVVHKKVEAASFYACGFLIWREYRRLTVRLSGEHLFVLSAGLNIKCTSSLSSMRIEIAKSCAWNFSRRICHVNQPRQLAASFADSPIQLSTVFVSGVIRAL